MENKKVKRMGDLYKDIFQKTKESKRRMDGSKKAARRDMQGESKQKKGRNKKEERVSLNSNDR